jgi:ubiquinone/menaquinone biosynthesis C-methylase UbiE
VRAYYEDLWTRLPGDLEPPELARRRAHLAAHVRPGDRVLDLGCGDGPFLVEISALGATPIGVDVADAALARARRRAPDAELHRVEPDGPLPLPDRSVDAVWCSETLEHVADTARFLAEARRVLRPGGALAVTVPRVRRLAALLAFERHFPPLGDHVRFYTARSLADVLDDADLEAIDVARSGPLLLASARRS